MGYVIVFAFWKCQEENNISWHIALECIVVSNAFSNEEQMIGHYWRLVIELDHVSSFVLGAIPRAQYWIIWMNFQLWFSFRPGFGFDWLTFTELVDEPYYL